MAWLSRVNFIASDTLSFTDVNNLGNDIRAWGDNVNGGGYTLSNVILSASSGVMPTVTGGSAAGSTLTLRSTSGAGSTDAIIFSTASQLERMRINTAGDVNIGAANNAGNTLRFFDLYNTNTGSSAGAIARLITSDVAGTSTAVGQIIKYKNGTMLFQNSETDSAASIQFFVGASERIRINSSGNVGIGTSAPSTESTNARLALVGAVGQTASSLATTNTNAVATFRGDAGSGYLLNIGAVSADGSPYLQGCVFNGGSSASNLLLQPYGGNVGVRTSSPATSAALEIAGTTGALLVPRLTTTERNALTAVNGMIIYNTTDNQMQGRINGAWTAM